MVLTITQLKALFATTDKPSGKNFTDLIDTIIYIAQAGMATTTLAAVNAAIAAIATGANIVVQPTPPNASFGNSIWFKTDPTTGAILRAYQFFGTGASADNNWHSRHPLAPGTIVAVTDPAFNIATLASYDGGGTPYGTTVAGCGYPSSGGAMWVQATDLVGNFLIGAGGAYPIGTTGGEAAHTLAVTELPAHSHGIAIYPDFVNVPDFVTQHSVVLTEGGTRTPIRSSFPTAPAGGGLAHNNLPPYKAAYFLRRTAKLDYIEAPGA